jgi:hypothetical protein
MTMTFCDVIYVIRAMLDSICCSSDIFQLQTVVVVDGWLIVVGCFTTHITKVFVLTQHSVFSKPLVRKKGSASEPL